MPPMPTVLITRLGGGTPAVHRLSGGTSISAALDGTWGVSQTPALNSTSVRMSTAVEFKGFIYVASADSSLVITVRRRPVTGGAWALVVNQAGQLSMGGSIVNGPFVVNTGNGPVIAVIYRANNNNPAAWFMIRSTDGTTWSFVSLGTPLATGIEIDSGGMAIYRGQLIFPVPNTSAVNTIHVDVQAGSITSVSGVGGTCYGHAVCVFKNRLFMVVADGAHIGTLYELVGGVWQSRGGLPTSYVGGSPLGSNGNQGHCALQAVGDSHMVAIYLDATGNNTNFHWKACDITVSGATFNFTLKAGLIPASLQQGGAAASKNTFGWASFIDNETVPGTPAVFFWSWGPLVSGSFVYYEYVDSDSELLGSALAIAPNAFSLPNGQGGGERINTSDADLLIDSVVLTASQTPGRARLTVVCRGATGVSDKILRGFFNTQENPILTQMTLAGTPTGGSAVRVGNEIQQVEANPAITYVFDWDASAQGIFNNQRARIYVEIATV